MTCEEIQEKLLTADMKGLTAEVQKHLASCGTCRHYALLVSALSDEPSVTLPEVPERLDAATCACCHKELALVRRRRALARKVWYSVSAVAAVVVVAFCVLMTSPANNGGNTPAMAQNRVEYPAVEFDEWRLRSQMACNAIEDWESDLERVLLKSDDPLFVSKEKETEFNPTVDCDLHTSVDSDYVDEMTELEALLYLSLN